jgi:hypothetical protein
VYPSRLPASLLLKKRTRRETQHHHTRRENEPIVPSCWTPSACIAALARRHPLAGYSESNPRGRLDTSHCRIRPPDQITSCIGEHSRTTPHSPGQPLLSITPSVTSPRGFLGRWLLRSIRLSSRSTLAITANHPVSFKSPVSSYTPKCCPLSIGALPSEGIRRHATPCPVSIEHSLCSGDFIESI